MFRMMLAALALLALAGCGSDPQISSATPRSVTTVHDHHSYTSQDAAAIAEAHCQAQGGLHAREAAREDDDFNRRITWDCVP